MKYRRYVAAGFLAGTGLATFGNENETITTRGTSGQEDALVWKIYDNAVVWKLNKLSPAPAPAPAVAAVIGAVRGGPLFTLLLYPRD